MSVDAAFTGVGKSAGLIAWRIEKKVPVRVPQENIWKLHTGDSYIFLQTIQTSSAFRWNIHFWLGNETSQDESGIAAYKTVELDESLGGGPVQYRECQGHESALFLSYFKSTGLEYLAGGIESGFTHVDRDAYETKLLHVKGKRTVRVTQVPTKNSNLNRGDVFILDMGMKLFLYNGDKANRMEKAKGVDVINQIKNDERGGKAVITFIDEDKKNKDFWGALGGFIEVTNEGEDDEAVCHASTQIYRISDESGSLSMEKQSIADGKLRRDDMDSNDVFLLDVKSEIFVWIGKNASQDERRKGIQYATDYLSKNEMPMHTPITRIVEGSETPVFKSLFVAWNKPKQMMFGGHVSTGVAKTKEQKDVNVNSLISKREHSEDMVDDGSGKLEIWRIEDMQKVPVPTSTYGQFFGGDSYIILYTYMVGPSEEYLIYFWQGRDSSTDEKGASALLSKELDDSMGGKPVQVRVVQGKEPAHFRQLFKGSMIVKSGGKASGFKNSTETDSYDTDGVELYHVKGSSALNTMASQVDEKCANLNSGDCFVLLTPEQLFLWIGSGSSEEEKSVARNVAKIINSQVAITEIKEHEEPVNFFEFLGGKTDYATIKTGDAIPSEPRLFQCSNVTGSFEVEEVMSFAQDDLNVDDVFLLDTYSSVFVWIGSGANEQEKRMSLDTAEKYLNAVQDGRESGTPIITVNSSHEPPMFTCHFLAWDPTLFTKNVFLDPYEARLAKLKEEKLAQQAKFDKDVVAPPPAPVVPTPAPSVAKAVGGFYKYEQLVAGVDGIDISKKESYMSDAEFQTVMKMSKEEFSKLAKWKQQSLKKSVKLF